MLSYAQFIRKLVRHGSYRSVIALTTLPAMCLADILHRRYAGRYILDIRDYSYEKNTFYSSILGRIIREAYCVFLSSDGFKTFLPESDHYLIMHNVPKSYSVKERKGFKERDRFRIGFVGAIRFFQENVALIQSLKDSDRFQLKYYGSETAGCELRKYCEDNGIGNTVFYGRFDNDKKSGLYDEIDIINAIYGTEGLETTTAIPNRLYDAAIYGCPIISSKGTYLAQVVEAYHLGFAVDVYHDDIVGKLERYISSFNEEEFAAGCRRLLADTDKDMKVVRICIDSFFDHCTDMNR